MNVYSIEQPWQLHLKKRRYRSSALSWLYIICFSLCTIVAIGVFFSLAKMPLIGSGTQPWKRGSMLGGWTLFSLVLLVVFAWGFLGFLGHNSAPSPEHTAQFQWPSYLGTLLYTVVGVLLWRAVRRRHRQWTVQADNAC
jgi:protein-S-isoprenylcysteine O-methyltransferase Ste14